MLEYFYLSFIFKFLFESFQKSLKIHGKIYHQPCIIINSLPYELFYKGAGCEGLSYYKITRRKNQNRVCGISFARAKNRILKSANKKQNIYF